MILSVPFARISLIVNPPILRLYKMSLAPIEIVTKSASLSFSWIFVKRSFSPFSGNTNLAFIKLLLVSELPFSLYFGSNWLLRVSVVAPPIPKLLNSDNLLFLFNALAIYEP
ncbi:hypothetical protein MYMA111404_01595 [Mycoplasma marinum]